MRVRSVRTWSAAALRPLLLVLALLGVWPAGAHYARLGLGQFNHTRWTTDDGTPATGVAQIAQTPDGWLWLTSSEGLYRFDGVTFERIAAPIGSPMERASPATLLVSRSGELWVGYNQNGGVAVVRGGRLQEVHMAQRPALMGALAQTPDGAIWAMAEQNHANRLYRWKGRQWETLDARLGLPEGFLGGPCVTADGTLWLSVQGAGDRGYFISLPPGGAKVLTSPIRASNMVSCAIDRQGRLWIADRAGTRLVAGSDGQAIARPIVFPAVPRLDLVGLAFDAAGGLWGGTNSVGIFYIPHAGKPHRAAEDRLERFVAADGLTADGVYAPFVDREGNIWFGSDAGLNRFRPSSAVREPGISGDNGQGFGMSRAGGEIFIAATDGVSQMTSGRPRKIFDHGLEGLCPARGGGFWGVRSSEIVHFRDGRRSSLPRPAGVELAGNCAEDRSGHLWVTTMQGAMWHDAGGWHSPSKPGPPVHLPDLVTTPEGDVAYVAANALVRLSASGVSTTPLDPYDIGTIFKIAAGPRDIFVSGNNGLLRIRGNRIARIDARRFPWVARLRDLVQTASGETWLRRALWISRVSTADLDRAFDDARAPLPRRSYDLRDGLVSAQDPSFTGPQIGAGSDGRIWLLDRKGVSYIDPAKLERTASPPPVVIRSLASGGILYRDPGTLTLPAGTHSLDIGYAGLSLAAPHRMEFRYRLEGVDDDWVSAGTRRLASYANLGPGRYRFRVIAAQGDGKWNGKGATLEFEIPPTFLQSWPFKLLCGLIVLALLWLAYSLRLRTVAHHIRRRMAERMEERERIARDLHDTLLQSVQSLTLRFQLVVDELPIKESARPALEAAIDRADQVIAEGRDRLIELRSREERSDIEQIIADIVRQQGFDPAVAVSIETAGTPHRLDPPALEEIARIAGEAIFNIWRHARATRITIGIGFHPRFSLCFVDNGVGIDPSVVDHGGKDGHFGLPGMRERARKLHGDLVVRAIPEGGTQLVLSIAGRIAYKPERARWFSRLRGKI